MNKVYIYIFSFLLIIFFSIPLVKEEVLNVFNFTKEMINDEIAFLNKKIFLYKNQAKKIEILEKENKKLQKELAILNSYLENCIDLKKFKFIKDSHLIFTRVISYAKLPDFSQIYVDFKGKRYPKGLVYNNFAAGILVKKVGNYSLGVLNSNKKATYTVFIGKKEIPGIFFGKENVIKYIPKYKKINIGDLVITSGLDGIFYKGAKVGIITEIKNKKLYQEAKVKLFYDRLNPHYFYVVDKNLTIRRGNGITKH